MINAITEKIKLFWISLYFKLKLLKFFNLPPGIGTILDLLDPPAPERGVACCCPCCCEEEGAWPNREAAVPWLADCCCCCCCPPAEFEERPELPGKLILLEGFPDILLGYLSLWWVNDLLNGLEEWILMIAAERGKSEKKIYTLYEKAC